MKLDILVLAVHPDDAELSCGGTIIKQVKAGRKVGMVDFTRGELGTRGTPDKRDKEAAAAAEILGLSVRINLGYADGFFTNDKEHQLGIIQAVRRYRPEIVITNAITDRHPDHGRASQLANDALFLSGLRRIETEDNGSPQEAWRPRLVLQYIQDSYIKPHIIVDISDVMAEKEAAIRAFDSQFFNQSSAEPGTYISRPDFFDSILSRSREYGKSIGAAHGEGFTSTKLLGVDDIFHLL